MQAFKETDAIEAKFVAAALPVMELVGDEKNAFWEECYEAYPLGELIFALKASPVAGLLPDRQRLNSTSRCFALFGGIRSRLPSL